MQGSIEFMIHVAGGRCVKRQTKKRGFRSRLPLRLLCLLTFDLRQHSPGPAGKRVIISMVIIEMVLRLIVLVVRAVANLFISVTIQVCEKERKRTNCDRAAIQ